MLAYILTFSRLALAAAFAVAVAVFAPDGLGTHEAVALIVLAIFEEVTDLLDGMAARAMGTASLLGGLFDPLSDSLSRLTMYFAMALVGWVTVAVPLVMTARDVIVAYTRTVRALTGGRTSARLSGKVKALIQGGAIPVLVIVATSIDAGFLPHGPGWWSRVAVAAMLILVTVWSLVDYLCGAWEGIVELYGSRRTDQPDEA